ncbi:MULTISPECIES: glutamate--cysteine ligase [unclassified Undibacterium]|uniref:glutamate--cysteine ligase n=1 Tax=unclassified Undibacterium TaxID=2630295 RepID=UPI002AC985C4|nr:MULTISPECIES: glutamate--cysteine ligase [unclassified Undibacterium]MEB0138901.1 glutamate--cysteine ligase [Undibacterium sp. CCC2.1]MEB0171768.1 glutamate--cysteine ligase [Undibacterium sp. CCC1.1]MEB0175532.1 glutamate--cysteine ligase [Undibacterium sp. CCC3.4]MEB0214970.1 glutamate--cysteine ligase [Undibacterium sp. 5I2]WPX44951.1 glutamate--cysteine ligase [Undibacterium sp. CCC3.4]
MVPHLVTALNGPLLDLEKKILEATPAIERWFRLEWQEHTPPFYCSVDLRNAGFKLAPVDTNLFPGGFNNLAPEMLPLAVQAAMAAIEKYCPDAKNLLLIPENDTSNPCYLQHIARTMQIFRQTGLNVRLGALSSDITEPTPIDLPDGSQLILEPLIRSPNGRRLGLENFDPCTIVLNNDLSTGIPGILEDLNEQTLLPPLHAGWALRRKSNHFSAYDEVVKKFAKMVDIDPWMLNPYFIKVVGVNFKERTGEDALAAAVDTVLAKIRKKYKEYGIKEKPFVIVKADAGTYGMGIMTVHDASEVRDLDRTQRNTMSVIKVGMEVRDVIVQEGVYTFEQIKDAVAEPVVYMIDRYVVGGFYRFHAGRGVDENLNAPGMHFVPLAFAQQPAVPDVKAKPGAATPNRFYLYGVVARLALLAASLEMERTDPNPEIY